MIDRKNLAPCIICIACYFQSGGRVDFGNVTLQVLAEVVIGSVVVESDDSAAAVVVGECPCAVAFAQKILSSAEKKHESIYSSPIFNGR